jgi:hypothetical protein
MMGGSHISRLTDELDDMCLKVTDISVKGWKLTDEAVEEKVQELRRLLITRMRMRTTIMYQLLSIAV